jgi:hypothetical protein
MKMNEEREPEAMTSWSKYDHAFFEDLEDGSRQSAQRIVPLVLSLVKARSVVDVGCGECSWLAEFLRQGIDDVRGLDGAYVPADVLKIPERLVSRCNLCHPFKLDRQFDLAISLETAEHLPPARAEGLVADLVRLSPQVLFSAAIPFQRGTHHINCQWPDYWQELFRDHDYLAFDVIRPEIWYDDMVEFWYRQNSILYIRRDEAQQNPVLKHLMKNAEAPVKRWAHSGLWESWDGFSVRELLALLPATLIKALERKWPGHLSQRLANTR